MGTRFAEIWFSTMFGGSFLSIQEILAQGLTGMRSRNFIPFPGISRPGGEKMIKPFLERKKSHIIDNEIKFLRPFIDRVVLSGFYDYSDLNDGIGRLFENNSYLEVRDHNGEFVKKRSQYKQFLNAWYRKKQISVLLGPPKVYQPLCILEMTQPSQEWLIRLNTRLPGLNVSSVEYAVDIYTQDSRSAQDLLHLLAKYLHCRWKRSSRMIGENLIESPSLDRMNTVIHLDNAKFYSRGPDKKKREEGWNMEDCDRVRIDFKATNEYYLRRYGITKLDEFIKMPWMNKILDSKFQFRTFHKSVFLGIPGECEFFNECDENGVPVTFQSRLIELKRKVSNIYPYVIEPRGLKHLQFMWQLAISRFDWNWVRHPPEIVWFEKLKKQELSSNMLTEWL